MFDFDFDIPPLDWRTCRIPKPKKPGEFRKLTIPNDRLKEVQRFIYDNLKFEKDLRPSAFAHGFVPFRNTCTGAIRHSTMSPVIICMDMKDFFDRFPLEPIRQRMLDAGMNDAFVDKILKVCSYNNTIPQGSPTSPFLTNVGMFHTDLKLSSYAADNGFTYSRYADDLTFALREDAIPKKSYFRFIKGVEAMLKADLGVELNRKKTHIIRLSGKCPREITGVVVRKDGMGYNAPRKQRRIIRAKLCNLYWKVVNQGGSLQPEDFGTWATIKGYVCYSDYLRSYSPCEEAATADPVVQEKFWNYLKEKFESAKSKN